MSETIFIHIPKTGGTTINSAMQGTYWQTEPGFNYRHILPDKSSNSGDIFDSRKYEQYKEHDIFMMVRHPVDRMISEYYFIKERNEFVDLLKPKPKDFESYIRNRQTQNYMTGFLKGKRMYSTVATTEDDLEDVLQSIDELNIHVGIFERYADSLSYFSNQAKFDWKKDISIKRMTLRRPKVSEITDEMRALIEECNSLDLELYNYCLERFDRLHTGKGKTFSFHGDKYDHVVAYAARACFYEFCLEDKNFIKQNFNFFKDVTFYLLNEKGIKDGRTFASAWNSTFLKTFSANFPDSDLTKALNDPEVFHEDPIEHAHTIGKIIDENLVSNKDNRGLYRGMQLDKSLVDVVEKTQPKKGLFGKLFGK